MALICQYSRGQRWGSVHREEVLVPWSRKHRNRIQRLWLRDVCTVNNFRESLGNIREIGKDKKGDKRRLLLLKILGKRESERLCCWNKPPGIGWKTQIESIWLGDPIYKLSWLIIISLWAWLVIMMSTWEKNKFLSRHIWDIEDYCILKWDNDKEKWILKKKSSPIYS